MDKTDKFSISGSFRIPEEIISTEVEVRDSVVSRFVIFAGTIAFLLWGYVLFNILFS